MEENGWAARNRNPRYIVAGVSNGIVFAIAAGNNQEELQSDLQDVAAASGNSIPKLSEADIYVKLENGVVSPRTGFDIVIPE